MSRLASENARNYTSQKTGLRIQIATAIYTVRQDAVNQMCKPASSFKALMGMKKYGIGNCPTSWRQNATRAMQAIAACSLNSR